MAASDRAFGMDARGTIVFGVGAIVGGGIIVLAGPALVAAGPATLLALLLNAVVAVLAALSLGELATRFPRSGGPYTFAQQVFSVRAAFAVGWLVYFASLAAAAVFALGFAEFALTALGELGRTLGAPAALAALSEPGAAATGAAPSAAAPAPWWTSRAATVGLALAAVAAYALQLLRGAGGGGAWPVVGKVVTLGALGVAGLIAVARAPGTLPEALTPFAPNGALGVAQAMGLLFVSFQGFALIAATAGEVRHPERDVPRGMLIAIAVATLLYLPLFLAILTVGVPAGETLAPFAERTGGTTVAEAARTYLGPAGFWLVSASAILAMLTALQANLFAASRVARAMASDRTLPRGLARLSPGAVPRRTLLLSTALVGAIVVALPTVATAGSAAGLIYLSVFALCHVMALLARRRAVQPAPFRAPLAPWLPLGAALFTLAIALVNAVAVPSAGALTLGWLLLGALIYVWLLGREAASADAEREGARPDLLRLRGRRPLVLVPVANPASAEALVTVAHALAPPEVGRVLVLTVVERSSAPDSALELERAQRVQLSSLSSAFALGLAPDTLTTVAADPWEAITRIAHAHACEVVVLGLSRLDDAATLARVDRLFAAVSSDVVLLRAPAGWHLERVRKVVVPLAGGAQQETLRSRLLGTLSRLAAPQVTFVRVLPRRASEASRRRLERALVNRLEGRAFGRSEALCLRSDDPVGAIAGRAADADLLVLGLPPRDAEHAALGTFARALLRELPPSCAALLIHRR
jgi:basic amino acid/polyamine antiporter, APA family